MPIGAVLRYAGVARVFVIDHGVVRAREVTTGIVAGDQVEITGGLKEVQRVSDVDRLADRTAMAFRGQP